MEKLDITFVTISRELAYRAHTGTSFSPEKRADSHIKEFNETVKGIYDKHVTLIKCEASKRAFIEAFNNWQAQYKNKYENWLNRKGNCISSMIAGPSNFPVKRAERANNAEHRASEELTKWFNNSEDRCIVYPVQSAYADEVKKEIRDTERNEHKEKQMNVVRKGLIHAAASVCGEIHALPQLMKGASERQINNLVKMGYPQEAKQLIEEYNEKCKDKCGKVIFTSRHRVFKFIEEYKQPTPEEKETGEKEIAKGEDYTVINNFDAERVQILFDDKPDETVRKALKGESFKWSRFHGAWQRKNTDNGLRAVNRFIKWYEAR